MSGVPSQGEIVCLEESGRNVLVVSRDFFNLTGLCVLCPVVSEADPDALHIPVRDGAFSGVVLCEQLKSLDLSKRFYRSVGRLPMEQIMDITDAVQAIFDYYSYGT